jgi:hypothetical protein
MPNNRETVVQDLRERNAERDTSVEPTRLTLTDSSANATASTPADGGQSAEPAAIRDKFDSEGEGQ